MEDAMRWLHLASSDTPRGPLTSISEAGTEEEGDTNAEQQSPAPYQSQLLTDLATVEEEDTVQPSEDDSTEHRAEGSKAQHLQHQSSEFVEQELDESFSAADAADQLEIEQDNEAEARQVRDAHIDDGSEADGPLEVTHLWSLNSEIPATGSQEPYSYAGSSRVEGSDAEATPEASSSGQASNQENQSADETVYAGASRDRAHASNRQVQGSAPGLRREGSKIPKAPAGYDAQYKLMSLSPHKRPWNHGHHKFQALLKKHKSPQKKRRSNAIISQARLLQLSQIPKHKLAQREEEKREADEKDMADCTFKPQINRSHAEAAVRSNVPVEDRLYQAHLGRHERWAAQRRLLEEEMLKDCTFAPKLHKGSTSKGSQLQEEESQSVPLHERLGQLQLQRSARQLAAEWQAEQPSQDCTFTPAINRKSAALANLRLQRSQGGELVTLEQRLTAPSRHNTGHAGMLGDATAALFTPTINARSDQMVQDSLGLPADFLARQQHLRRRHEQKLARLAQRLEEEDSCTFVPHINTSLSTATAPELLAYYGETQREKAARQMQYYSQYTFSPQLNERSRHLSEPHSLDELAQPGGASRARQQAAEAAEQHLMRECTFQPNLSRQGSGTPPGVTSQGGGEGVVARLAESRQDRISARAAHLEQLQAAAQESLLADCTFQPAVNHRRRRPNSKEQPSIAGLENYLQRKERAKQQQQDFMQRVEKAFVLNPQTRTEPTICKPFHLRNASDEVSELRRQQLLKREALAHCTFRPNIHEAVNCRLMSTIVRPCEE
ncbi:hypothetical protein WJX73_002011 [Symbiochloris irregularis]|uniref:Uncharacterized protein n=1 Tax=Symbiochloris irregularis TaxID=706552 RepID=A0AAW1P348_9CHLO